MSDHTGKSETARPPAGAPLNPAAIGALAPIEVLEDQRGNEVYTAKVGMDLVLVYQASVDEQRQTVRLMVVPISAGQVDALKRGDITILQALDQPRVWMIDRGFDGAIKTAVSLANGIAAVPEADKPPPSARLPQHLSPRTSG